MMRLKDRIRVNDQLYVTTLGSTMNDRIVINGILYEKVVRSHGDWHPEGKFSQIVHYESPEEVFLGITDPKTRNSKFPFILCVDWVKGYKDQLDRAALSAKGLENEDIDDIEMNYELSKKDVSKICRYIIDLDTKRTKPWDRNSIEKLRKELHRKYGFVSKEDFLHDYCSSEWRDYIQSGFVEDEYWRDIVIGKYDYTGFDDDYTPDKQWDDEYHDYYDMVFGPGNW